MVFPPYKRRPELFLAFVAYSESGPDAFLNSIFIISPRFEGADPPHLSPGWKDDETTDSRWPINLKISAVESKDPPQPFALGDAHQSDVSQIHRQIAILSLLASANPLR
jgi:hypothetical protein